MQNFKIFQLFRLLSGWLMFCVREHVHYRKFYWTIEQQKNPSVRNITWCYNCRYDLACFVRHLHAQIAGLCCKFSKLFEKSYIFAAHKVSHFRH